MIFTKRLLFNSILMSMIFLFTLISAPAISVLAETIDFADAIEYESNYSYGDSVGDGLAVDKYKDFSWQYGIGEALELNSKKVIPLDEKFYYYPDSTARSQGKNCYSLTEFDIFTEKSNSSPMYDIYLNSSQSIGRFFGMIRVEGGKISVAGNVTEPKLTTPVLSEPVQLSEDEWHHVRILMQCTNEDKTACSVISSVSVDGKEIFTSNEELILEKYKLKLKYYDMICIQNRKNTPGGYIDNISVKRINEYTGSGLPADKGELLYSIRKTADFLHQYSFMAESPYYLKLKKQYQNAVNILESDGTATDYSIAAKELINAYESVFKQNNELQIKEILYTTDGKIKGVMVNNLAETKKANVLLGFYAEDQLKNCCSEQNITIPSGLSEIVFKLPFALIGDYSDAFMYLWNQELNPIIVPIDIKKDVLNDNLSVKFNGNSYFTDTSAHLAADGTVFVPAENILNLLGATMIVQDDGTYFAERIDGTFINFNVGSDSVTSSAGVVKTAAPYLYKDCLPMISIQSLCDIFGCSYYVDSETDTLNITSNYVENTVGWSAPSLGNILFYNVGLGSFCFKIAAAETAKVEVFTRVDETHAEEVLPVRYIEGTDEVFSGWNMPADSVILWKKAYDVKYKDKRWHGSFSGIRNNGKYYDIMYRITNNGVTKTYFKNRAVTLPSCFPELDKVVYQADSLKLIPTFENISYYYTSKKAENCDIYYKKTTENVWNKGFAPVFDERLQQYLGSVTNLQPDTLYDVKLVLDGVTVADKISTWTETPEFKEIPLSEIYDGGTLVLQGLKGTDDCWIKIKGDDSLEVNGGVNNWEAVYISDCENLILENITVTGGKRYGINVSGGSKNIRISNCDISNWGRTGVWSDESHTYRLDFGKVNYDSGIFLTDTENIVIERCYIHDCNARTNPWNGKDYNQVHPAGGSAIYTQMKSGLVVRYNDFIGNSINRWNDAIEGAFNSSYHAGVGFDADIYGNMFFGGNDDSMELDGGSMNVRVYKNRIEQFYCGISFAPILIGPVYVFGNLVYNLGDRETTSSTPSKQGSASESGNGKQFWFNNTFMAKKSSRVLNTTAYNNIIVSDTSVIPLSVECGGDYNLLIGKKTDYPQANQVNNALPQFTNYIVGDFKLKDSSPAKGAGTRINNFMDTDNPDIGASAYADKFPDRPVEIDADKSFLGMKDLESETFTITTGNVEDGLSFKVEKSSADSWIEISGDTEGTLKSNKKYHITVYTDMDELPKEAKIQNDDLSGVVLFRLSNGYSVPVTVRCAR